jgi:hypothetical protein
LGNVTYRALAFDFKEATSEHTGARGTLRIVEVRKGKREINRGVSRSIRFFQWGRHSHVSWFELAMS